MDKIKLIRSFADYPVWEYESDWNCYYLNDAYNTFIHKDIVERFKDHFEEVKERPTSWKELWEVNWYFINDDCEIKKANNFYTVYEDASNVYLTKEQAEASIALAQVTQLLDKYDIPESSNVWYHHDWYHYYRIWLLGFDTPEKRDHFYKHHKTLIDKLAPFYIF